jgi:hypothetical protein
MGSLVVVGYAPSPSLAPEDRGWLGGFLDGEGTIKNIGLSPTRKRMGSGGLAFCQNPGLVLERAINLMGRLGVSLSEPVPSGTEECLTIYAHGGAQTTIRVLQQVPSVRLRQALRKVIEAGDVCAKPLATERVVAIEWDVGECEVVDIQTSTGTFVANGYIVHNCGIQWIEYSENTRRFTRWSAPAWFPTPVTNAMAPRLAAMTAQLLRVRPAGRVRPNTTDPKDREAAGVGDKVLAYLDDVTSEDELRQEAGLVAALCGTVIFLDIFNPQAGKVLRVPRMQVIRTPAMKPAAVCPNCHATTDPQMVGQTCQTCGQAQYQAGQVPQTFSNGQPAMTASLQPETHPELDEEGAPHPQAGQPIVDEIPEGEVETYVRMLFNFYWDPKATKLEQAQWCGEATYADLDWIDRNFPEFGPYVGQETGIDAANFFESSLLSLVGPSMQGSAHQGGSQYLAHGAVLRRYEEKPSQMFPRGLLAIVANGVLLYQGDLPIQDENGTPTGDFSYTEFKYDMVPGRFAGRTPAEDMVALQRRINGIDAQVILNRKTMLNPHVIAPKGAGITPAMQQMRPGTWIFYNTIGTAAAPQIVPGQPLPAQIYEERQACFTSMDELAQDRRMGVQDLPQGVKSGIALNLLKEKAEEDAVPRLQRWGQTIAKRGHKRLLLVQQHYPQERTIRIMGPGSDWQVQYFKGTDLQGNTDVSVDPASLIPRSRSAEIQNIFDGIEQGLLNPQDPVQRQKIIERLNLQDFETEIGPDRRRQQKENSILDQGQQVPINETDNNETHLMDILPQIKDPSFDAKSPAAKMAYMQHYQAHKMALLQQLQTQMQSAPPGPGGPPGAGNAPPGPPGGGPPVANGPAPSQDAGHAASATAA